MGYGRTFQGYGDGLRLYRARVGEGIVGARVIGGEHHAGDGPRRPAMDLDFLLSILPPPHPLHQKAALEPTCSPAKIP